MFLGGCFALLILLFIINPSPTTEPLDPTPTPAPTSTPTPEPTPTPTPTVAAYLRATCWPEHPGYPRSPTPTPQAYQRAKVAYYEAHLARLEALAPPPGYAAYHHAQVYGAEIELWVAEYELQRAVGAGVEATGLGPTPEQYAGYREAERLWRLVPDAAKDAWRSVC